MRILLTMLLCLIFITMSSQRINEKLLYGKTWKLKIGNGKLVFKNKDVIETIGNEINRYQFYLTDSLKYNNESIRSSEGEKILVFTIDNEVVIFYYLVGLTNNKMNLLSGNNLESVVYYYSQKKCFSR